ncbi:MAG: cyclic nucleotide-binding protein [Actinomycetia bacterium]|nr:cyclic nucleotide-binding protein [Actinomycetes bacterium]
MARRNDLVAHLAEVPLFSHSSRRDLQEIARNTEVIDFPEGARIVSQGDAGNAFYVLLDGNATVRRNGRKVGELGPGDHFGELAVLDPAPRNADVVAATPVSVARLLVGPFRKMLRDVPTMNERLLAGLARRLRDADRRDTHEH